MCGHRNGTRTHMGRGEQLGMERTLFGHSWFLIISMAMIRLQAITHAHGVPESFPNSRSGRGIVLRTRRKTILKRLPREARGMVSELTWATSFPGRRTIS